MQQCVCTSERPTRAGGVGLILVFATVVVSITQPAQRDTAVVLTLKLISGTGVLVWREGRGEKEKGVWRKDRGGEQGYRV